MKYRTLAEADNKENYVLVGGVKNPEVDSLEHIREYCRKNDSRYSFRDIDPCWLKIESSNQSSYDIHIIGHKKRRVETEMKLQEVIGSGSCKILKEPELREELSFLMENAGRIYIPREKDHLEMMLHFIQYFQVKGEDKK
jgi:hypothetical protein